MERTLLDRSPEIAPLLARLHDRHKLYELAKDKEPQARSELASIMVDLLNIDLSEREKELLADVVIRLMRQAEADLRQALAQRLAAMDNVPLRMILMLANDEIQIAEPILRNSPILDDMDLVYLIKSKGEEHWQAIAKRKNLNPLVMNELADTRDLSTAINLAANDSVILTDKAISIFVEMSKESDELARPLLMRDEIPGIIGQVLYEFVGYEMKALIQDRFPIGADIAANQIDDLVEEFSSNMDDQLSPSHSAQIAVQNMALRDEVRLSDVMESLKRGQLGTFTALLAQYSHLPITTVQEILVQDTGFGLAVIAKAMSISKSDFMAMFLMTQRLRNANEKIVGHKDISKAGRCFDKMTHSKAQKILNESRH
ncbi:MAG: DUF2336 domain-containing protein [Pseudomonadota bacterium]